MTVQHMATFRTCSDNVSDAMSASIKSMNEFITKSMALKDELQAADEIVAKVYVASNWLC